MAQEKVFVKGFRVFPKHEKAPDFVLGTLLITPNEFFTWLKENERFLSDYKGIKQLKLNILKGDKGINFTVDTWKPNQNNTTEVGNRATNVPDDLPF